MKQLKGACILGQSGGPTSVINASAAGVFIEALNQECITNVYGAKHGIKGILNEEFYDISKEDLNELELLKTTPSSSIGSVRHKLKDINIDNSEYARILEVFKKHDIRYFFYNGGNDSMDTCNKISKFLKESGYECYCIGVPKTIDNDLVGTDHTPGYGSAAKYVATTLMEIHQDAFVYDTPMIAVVEIMGRNAGWLTAAAALASYKNCGPDLIYIPEVAFDFDTFIKDVEKVYNKNNKKVIIAVSEGIKTKDGKYIPELFSCLEKDSFGHAQLGGTAQVLAQKLKEHFKIKVRAIEFSLIQRCAQHLASATDVNEAFNAGAFAVKSAVNKITDKMVCFKRDTTSKEYKCIYDLVDLHVVANAEKTVPLEWLNEEKNGFNQKFIDYALPLIQGDLKAPLEDGLPRFSKLKKVLK
ncbi:MAG: 6-phosphofructokinase [Anaeroplasmataceae bacterium]